MLTIQIDRIKDDQILLEGQIEAADLSGLADLVASGQLSVTGPVTYGFRIYRVSGMIEIEGHVEAQVELSCSRCLAPVNQHVVDDFTLTYADHLPEVEDESGEEIELTAEDMGITLFEGEELDLAEPLFEQLVLGLPYQPLCAEGCKGLCPSCGTDLNKGACQCNEQQFDTRFAALKNLKIDSDKNSRS